MLPKSPLFGGFFFPHLLHLTVLIIGIDRASFDSVRSHFPDFKGVFMLHQLWNQISNRVRGNKKKLSVKPADIHIDNYHYESHRVDDLPLTIIKDPGPGIKYNYTENSEFSLGAPKTGAHGIDKFGDEKDTFDFEEADDYQDERNRNQNSDLSQRYFTRGMQQRNKDLHH